MTISERMLRKWRREALRMKEVEENPGSGHLLQDEKIFVEVFERILLMTQELLDQHLMKKKGGKEIE